MKFVNYALALFIATQSILGIPVVQAKIKKQIVTTTKKFEGRVLNAGSQQALEKATITAYYQIPNNLEGLLDSTKVSTNTSGEFQFTLPYQYTLSRIAFTHVGYSQKRISTPNEEIPSPIFLLPSLTNVGTITVQNKSFNGLSEVDYTQELGLDENLNEVLDGSFQDFTLNDIQTTLKSEVPSINKPQSSQNSSTVHLQGNRAPTYQDGIKRVNPSKLQVLGGTSTYTFDKIKVFESHTPEGGFPGSIQISSREKPQGEGISGAIFANPVIKEVYTETPIGDSAFVFLDIFKTDNLILKHLSDLRVPDYISLEAKLNYWQGRGVKKASIYYIGAEGTVKAESNKSGLRTRTKDNTLIFNFESQPKSFLGFSKYPVLETILAYQESRIDLGTNNNSIDLGLKRKRTNAKFNSSFFFPMGTLRTNVGVQADYMQLFGSLVEKTKVGDGGASFLQSFRKLKIGSYEIHAPLYVGLEKENFDINFRYTLSNQGSTNYFWTNFKFKLFGQIPTVVSGGHIKQNSSDMDLLDNRFIITGQSGVKQEEVNYICLKATKNFQNGVRIDLGGYFNQSLMNALREPDYNDILEYNTPITDTSAFLESLIAHPETLVPEPTFHLLKGGRIGGRLFVSTPLNFLGIDKLKARIRCERAYTFIPDWKSLHTTQDSLYFTPYEGTKITHPNSNGWSWEIEAKKDITSLVHSPKPLDLSVTYKFSQGKPYIPTSLIPLTYENKEGELVITEDGKLLYLKQAERNTSKRYPGTHDIDIRLNMALGKNSRAFLYVDNLLDNRAIIEEQYVTKHAVLSNGDSWHNRHNQRLIGAGFEYRFGK